MRARAVLSPRLAALAALLAADRLTKVWALEWLQPRASVPLLPFLHLTYVENTGAAFGIGRHRNAFFIALSAALTLVLLYLLKAWSGKSAWVRWGLVLVAGGAVGNLYDRVAYGFVVDFLDFRVWPVFNVADSCITVGGAALAWGMWREEDGARPRGKASRLLLLLCLAAAPSRAFDPGASPDSGGADAALEAGVVQGPRFEDIIRGLVGQALPPGPFRVHIRGGRAEYRPQPLNEVNRGRRRAMLALIEGGPDPLHRRLRELMLRTQRNRREHGAYVLPDGSLGPVEVGEPGSVGLSEPPRTGAPVGYVHTHPTPCEILAPPSGNDHSVLAFSAYPVQLVVECNRVWGVLEPRHATLLGSLRPGGGFAPLAPDDPTVERAYEIVDDGQLRMEQFHQEEREDRERRRRLRDRYYPPRVSSAPASGSR